MKTKSYATLSAKSGLVSYEYEPAPLKPSDVEVKITHCAVCHADIDLMDNDWGISQFPLIPGHEVIGTIVASGEEVTHLTKGQRVGIGWQCGACLSCEWCLRGDENLCPSAQLTCIGRPGGFAESIRIDSRFAFPIPPSIPSENAAPLMCAGVATYSPFRQYDIKPSMRVGIVGIGGLGHLAIQFARAVGCEVTAFSNSPEKEEEARRLGAHHFVHASDPKHLKDSAGLQDVILSTASAGDWVNYLTALRSKGKLILLTISPAPLSLPSASLVFGQKMVAGSLTGGRWLIQEMLEFSALHGIKAQTEVLPMLEANSAVQRVRDNKVRFRMVLKN